VFEEYGLERVLRSWAAVHDPSVGAIDGAIDAVRDGLSVAPGLRQMVHPARVTEVSLRQVNTEPVVTNTCTGPSVPQYFLPRMRIQS
jgi:hypothetical protein